MATVIPFRAYRYHPGVGAPGLLLTQPYDKITPAMQARYLAAHPKNLVRIILGERFPNDSDGNNVYTRAGQYFQDWVQEGTLQQDPEPALYPYVQEFSLPDDGERLQRKGFIGLGRVEEYEAGVVFRHERTLSGPKKDRRLVLDHTGAHFGQIFMLYSDPAGSVDHLLDEASGKLPSVSLQDEYGTSHRLWRAYDTDWIRQIQALMRDKPLLIADGHHRYETALGYRRDHPDRPGAQYVMMTFVNMHSPGLRILATHRLLHSIPDFHTEGLLHHAREHFLVEPVSSVEELRGRWSTPIPDRIRFAVRLHSQSGLFALERPRRPGELDVQTLHDEILGSWLGITAEAVREEQFIRYIRGLEPAVQAVDTGAAQAAFLMEPATMDQVAQTSFAGGVMPQKSTDFFPKLLSGLAIYRLSDGIGTVPDPEAS